MDLPQKYTDAVREGARCFLSKVLPLTHGGHRKVVLLWVEDKGGSGLPSYDIRTHSFSSPLEYLKFANFRYSCTVQKLSTFVKDKSRCIPGGSGFGSRKTLFQPVKVEEKNFIGRQEIDPVSSVASC